MPDEQKKKLVLVFQGRQGAWVGMGRELYKNEEVFRKCVQECCRIIDEIDGENLLAAFENDEGAISIHEREPTRIYAEAIIQIALSELWISKGLQPDATIGLSLGEATAPFMNGIFDIADTLAICRTIAHWERRATGQSVIFVLKSNLEQIRTFYEMLSIELECYALLGPKQTVVFCPPDQQEILGAALTESAIEFFTLPNSFGYHMTRFAPFKELVLNELSAIKFQSPKYNFYSSMSGGLAPREVLFDANYWYSMISSSTYFYHAATNAMKDGYNVFLNVGAHGALTNSIKEIALELNKDVEILESMRNDKPEIETFYESYDELKKLGFIK